MRMRKDELMLGEKVDFILFGSAIPESAKPSLPLSSVPFFHHFLPKKWPCSADCMQGEPRSPSQSRSRCTMKGIGREAESAYVS